MTRRLELVVSDSMAAQVEAAKPSARRSSKHKRPKDRPERTYEVKFILPNQVELPWTFRIRRQELTPQQMLAGKAIFGLVAWSLPGNKWTPYTRGVVDLPSPDMLRMIRELSPEELT